MDTRQLELWTKIRNFDIDGGEATLTFAKRLARENGWSLHFANRVIEEYKRFVFLCMSAGHKCTPSEQVDQAWHLHLVYTESYWTRFCGEVLPRPLHHGPTKGGQAEDDKFVDWYGRTLESYRRVFDSEPPVDIWPAASDRFEGRWQRVDSSKVWLVPRRALRLPAAASLTLASLAGCGALAQTEGVWIPFILLMAFCGIGIIWLVYAASTGRLGNNSKSNGSGCSSSGGCAGSGCSSGCSSGCGGGGCGGGGCGS